jgi:hypothetical protein
VETVMAGVREGWDGEIPEQGQFALIKGPTVYYKVHYANVSHCCHGTWARLSRCTL